MPLKVCIRKETKSRWEGRAPLTPEDVKLLVSQNMPVWVERSHIRIYPDHAYAEMGAALVDHSDDADVVLGIKEPHPDLVRPGQVHLAFSHTIKGQSQNMPLLRTFLARDATLIDYETVKDSHGSRLIAFGRYAGLAGAVDTFHMAGRKLAMKNLASALSRIEQTYRYRTLARLKQALAGLHAEADDDVRVAIVGTGNVGSGCVEICEALGVPRIEASVLASKGTPPGNWYCALKTADVVRARNGDPFNQAEYRAHGSARYQSIFESYLGKFNILLQTPYWEEKYPRLLPRDVLAAHEEVLPYAIGDISCDIDGSLACTLKCSTIEEPAFTYDPKTGRIEDGISWKGPSIMSIDHLPCELSQDASEHFSKILAPYLPEIMSADLDRPLEETGLSPELMNATIVYKGELTPRYAYLKHYL